MPLNTSAGLNPQEQSLVSAAQPKLQPTGGQTPAQAVPQASPSQSALSGGLDPQAVNLAKAIRQTESGGNFTAQGKSGEYGAYQWEEPTWQKMSAQAGVNTPLQQATPEQQNQVAYTQVKAWKDQGYNPAQIASMWNSGNPNAYQEGNVGTNAQGVHYDTGAYVKSVYSAYQQLKAGGQPGADPNNPSSTAAPQTDSSLTGIPVVDSIANFLFPIAGDIKNDITGQNKKSALQQVGDAGLSAIPFIPGLGEAGEAARGVEAGGEAAAQAPRIISKLMGSNLTKGAALGYGSGALGNLSQGQSIGQAISPNIGTLGGAALGGAANSILPKVLAPFSRRLSAGGAQTALDDSLATEARKLKPTGKIMAEMPNGGVDALKTISRTPDALPTVVDNHHFDTTQGQQIMQQRQGQLSQLRATALTKMGTVFSLQDLEKEALAALQKQSPNAPDLLARGEQITQTIAGYTKNYGGDAINPLQMEAIKESAPYADPIARTARAKLENAAQTAGAPDLNVLNKQIQSHINAEAILKKMHQQTVKGGRLGNALRGITMGGVGAAVGTGIGSALGNGWLGTVGGALAGEGVNGLLSSWRANTSLTTPLQEAMLERLQQEDPQIVQQYAKYVGQENPVTPQRKLPPRSPVGSTMRNLLVSSAARAPGAVASH